jgi:hypothetical protein
MRFEGLVLLVTVGLVAVAEASAVYHFVAPLFDAFNHALAS